MKDGIKHSQERTTFSRLDKLVPGKAYRICPIYILHRVMDYTEVLVAFILHKEKRQALVCSLRISAVQYFLTTKKIQKFLAFLDTSIGLIKCSLGMQVLIQATLATTLNLT